MKQRERLRKCFQNLRTVSEFIYELEEIINMIGLIDKREKVIRLWDGLCPLIRKGLWRDGYNPEVSSWEEIKHAAQVIEISEEVSDGQEHRVTFDCNGDGSGNSFAGGRRNRKIFYCNNNSFSHNGNGNHSQNGHRQNVQRNNIRNNNRQVNNHSSNSRKDNVHHSNNIEPSKQYQRNHGKYGT